ncbi:MAG: AAA-like domain-containing protein [Bacteroidia bacterium]|nr:AAA-like domain-containing protein [Bacteroidia bacterium]
MRTFNTSGPNIPDEHYTLKRESLIEKGFDLVRRKRYFTIWAPRQTGKSTYFRLLANKLNTAGHKTLHINVENFLSANEASFLKFLCSEWNECFKTDIQTTLFSEFYKFVKDHNKEKFVLIIDEVEGLNPEIFGQFLHTIRNLYHFRESHCLKSVVLVGVSNILGIVQDNASPFNIADNLEVTYFTEKEVFELLQQHEDETGQQFDKKVKLKIFEITAGQPGLVNGFAERLVQECGDKPLIEYSDYLEVEHWYLHKAIDKNVANIVNKAKEYHRFVEQLLFTEKSIPYNIDREAIKFLHVNGIITDDENNKVKFWVPLYKKRLYNAFYPYLNGEKENIAGSLITKHYIDSAGKLDIEKLDYVKRNSFRPFREKDKKGAYKSIKEAALIYSFETYIQAFIDEFEGKCYREADTGLGKSDMIVNLTGEELLFETKKYYSYNRFEKGKMQLAYYCTRLALNKAIYLIFLPNNLEIPIEVCEQTETIDNVEIITYIIKYDEKKDF